MEKKLLETYMNSNEGILLESYEELYAINYYKLDSNTVASTDVVTKDRMLNTIQYYIMLHYVIKKNSNSIRITDPEYKVDVVEITKIQDGNWQKRLGKEVK